MAVVISCEYVLIKVGKPALVWHSYKGSRSQFFIALHRYSAVSWHVKKIDRGIFNRTNLVVTEGRTGFHEIIGYNYKIPRCHQPTVVESLPLARGTFHSQAFRRTLLYQANHHRYRIPYNPDTPEEGDEGYDDTHSQQPATYPSSFEQAPESSTSQVPDSDWIWSHEHRKFWRTKHGEYEWTVAGTQTQPTTDSEWMWSEAYQDHYRLENGQYVWANASLSHKADEGGPSSKKGKHRRK